MNYDIDLMLFKLIKKYDIFSVEPELYQYYWNLEFKEIMNELFDKFPQGKSVAIRGAGKNTSYLLSVLEDRNKQKIKYLIENNVKQHIQGFTNISSYAAKSSKIDIVILPSYIYREEFFLEFIDKSAEIEIIDIYDYITSKGQQITKSIADTQATEYPHITYVDVFCSRKMYQSSLEKAEKEYYLKKLIGQCIEIRDFISAKKYIEEYVRMGWDATQNYIQFLEELQLLREDIKEKVAQKKQEDIVINWVDNVSAEEMKTTDFYKKEEKNIYSFQNAYTVTPWTHFTMVSVMTGKTAIKDRTFEPITFTEENSKVLENLKRAGYRFVYIANPGLYREMFRKENLIEYPKGFEKDGQKPRAILECSTRLQWYSLRDRLISTQPVCHLIHNLAETHPPYFYSDVEFLSGERLKCRSDGLKFMSQQLEWYSFFQNEQASYIYLADHGNGQVHYRGYTSARTNIPLFIKSKKVPCMLEKRFFSHKDFWKIISKLISPQTANWNDVFREHIIYENLDLYNGYLIEKCILRWMLEGEPMAVSGYQYRGVRTSEDMYILYATGKELYFRLPNESVNRINDLNYCERISQLRQISLSETGEFIDISKEEAFKDSHMLYEYLDKICSEEIAW